VTVARSRFYVRSGGFPKRVEMALRAARKAGLWRFDERRERYCSSRV